ncbi:hypothetical protein V8E51_012538 [Hyaloscypha variabilis]
MRFFASPVSSGSGDSTSKLQTVPAAQTRLTSSPSSTCTYLINLLRQIKLTPCLTGSSCSTPSTRLTYPELHPRYTKHRQKKPGPPLQPLGSASKTSTFDPHASRGSFVQRVFRSRPRRCSSSQLWRGSSAYTRAPTGPKQRDSGNPTNRLLAQITPLRNADSLDTSMIHTSLAHVGVMNQFFGTQYSQEDLQQRLAERRRSNAPNRAGSTIIPGPQQQANDDTMDMMMGGGDSLDDIIMQNNQELQRRQSLPRAYPQGIDRRSSMMEFGSTDPNLGAFQFGPATSMSGDSNMRRQSTGELDMAAAFGNMANMGSGMSMPGQQMGYSATMVSDPLSIDTNAQFPGMSADMVHGMMGYGSMGMEGISEEDSNAMNMFSPTNFSQPYGPGTMDSMTSDFMMPQNLQTGLTARRDSMVPEEADEMMPAMPSLNVADSSLVNSPQAISMSQSMAAYSSPVMANMPALPTQEPPFNAPTPSAPIEEPQVMVKPERKPDYSGIYSTSGFDMLGALMKVANRRNPEVDLGKVDLSCAFVVCDITMYDCPIIYISEIFERLTGYTKHEIIGQNCRFLQDPNGKVQAGAYRNFVNNDSVYYLKQRIEACKEAQQSIINYRKGGQPFMNMLSMIPITGEDDKEIRYIVGFQVDLMLKPEALAAKGVSGLYTVDYSQENLPKYIWQPPEQNRPRDGGQTISRDDVSTVLSSINTSMESELTKRMWDKVLLENTDDVVHVLSLKGLFLYLSPSSRHVLEYDSSELVGTALSSVCHPSDIVPVTRELKDTSPGASVNVVFRIRRKNSGYTWFESHGSLCVEQGKGRKCIILVGRERPVYALARHDVEAAGGIGESEIWTKLSTSGMFLFLSSNVRTLLDRNPDDLVGTSIQALMRPESKVEFGRSLEKARTGKRVIHKHEILNKRGLVLQAQTTLYPGDAAEGQKPTFLVAQTRLLKSSSRSVAPALVSHNSGSSKGMSSLGHHPSDEGTPLSHPSGLSSGPPVDGANPNSGQIVPTQMMGAVTQAGGPRLPIGSQDLILASEDNIFDELKTTRCTSWQFELRQMEKSNRILAEELAALLQNKKKRKRRKGGSTTRDCANCHTRVTPEWRRGPSGNRDLCNSCGLRWAKQTGRVSPRTSTRGGDGSKPSQTQNNSQTQSQHSNSPVHSSPLAQEVSTIQSTSNTPNLNREVEKGGDMKGDGAAMPGSLGGRSTVESRPVHGLSQGFREGGDRGITRIREEGG